MVSQKRPVDSASVGRPPKKIQNDTETIEFVIYDFENRKEHRGEEIVSPPLKAHGYEWSIGVYPRGHKKSPTDHEYISCLLYFKEYKNKSVTIKGDFCCKGHENSFEEIEYNPKSSNWGYSNYLKRDNVLKKYLEDDGSLVISVTIQMLEGDRKTWYPKEPQQQRLWEKLYQNASSETSDVSFAVGNKIYKAHKGILAIQIKKLYEISKDFDSDKPIAIPSMKPETFKTLLDFVYTMKPDIRNKDVATELLVAADQYECVHLKLFVESVIAERFLSADNAAAFFIFADSKSCALLKEAATKLIVTEKATVMQSNEWSQIEESKRLLVELFNAAATSSTETSGEVDQMDVTALRMELEEAKLELDGCRELLIERLKAYR